MNSPWFFVALLFVFAVASQMEQADRLEETSRYCQDVRDNVHPDYSGRFTKDCGGTAPEFKPKEFAK